MSAVDLVDAPTSSAGRPGRFVPRLGAGALLAGVAFDVGLRAENPNAVLAAGLLVVVGLLLLNPAVERPEARGLVLAAAVPALFVALRASPWLAMANLMAFSALVAGCVLHARSGSVFDTTVRRLLQRTGAAGKRALGIPARLVGSDALRRTGPAPARALRIGRAVVVAFPLLAAIVALLASGDVIFARLLIPDVSPGPLLGHLVVVAMLGAGVAVTVATAGVDSDDEVRSGTFGSVEVVTMLVLAAGVVGLFVVSQLVALTTTGERLLASSGLTPAEYARSGFFQLCWASALLVAFLGLVRALAAPGVMAGRPVRMLAGWVPVLTLGLVAVSLRRMALYDAAFGLTMLRLAVVAVALWLGVVLVLLAVRNLTPEAGPNWVLGVSGAAALALVIAADLLNPEAFVVRHNVGRASAGAELDASYLTRLSDDTLPALAGALADPRLAPLHPGLRSALRCQHEPRGVADLNLSVVRAERERSRLCGR